MLTLLMMLTLSGGDAHASPPAASTHDAGDVHARRPPKAKPPKAKPKPKPPKATPKATPKAAPKASPDRGPSARPAKPDLQRPATAAPDKGSAPSPSGTRPSRAPASTKPTPPGSTRTPGTAPTSRERPATFTPKTPVGPRSESGAPVRREPLQRTPLAQRAPVSSATRPFDATKATVRPPARQVVDHRYTRPSPRHVRPYPGTVAPPAVYTYTPWYTGYWVHPYYRHTHVTYVVVGFSFVVHPWAPLWSPPARPGWTWVPGYWAWGWWHPGYWRPVRLAPVYWGLTYQYVPGWWYSDVYIDGYYRVDRRDGWVWVEGYYTEDGRYVPGHWRPVGSGPEGYVWEPGFFDGKYWVDGFWRPGALAGMAWVEAAYDADGLFRAGYWEPVQPNSGHVWIPGWFDGHSWQPGHWVTDADYAQADPATWEPEEGFDDGLDQPELEPLPDVELDPDEAPLAIPVTLEE